jgi:hypothetical protein
MGHGEHSSLAPDAALAAARPPRRDGRLCHRTAARADFDKLDVDLEHTSGVTPGVRAPTDR